MNEFLTIKCLRRNQLLLMLLSLICTNAAMSQDGRITRRLVFYGSYQSTLDTSKNSERVQFGSNNKLFDAYINNSLAKLQHITFEDFSDTVEVTFVVNSLGKIDSISFVTLSSVVAVNQRLFQIISDTSGKWKPAKRNNVYVNETVRLWIHLYSGTLRKKTLNEYVKEAESSLTENKYKKALKSVNNALQYDELNINAAILKGRILQSLDKKDEACDFLGSFLKFGNQRIQKFHGEYCN